PPPRPRPALAGGALVAVWGFPVIVAPRGASDSLDFGKQMDARLGMAGIGVDIWMRHFWFGGGAESFSYLFPRHASERLGAWFGDARMAHCDYVQVVADFGLVGLVAVGVVLGTVLVVLVKTGLGYSGWIGGAVAGALVAESFRAAMDFNLHVAPNLVLFALLVGGLMSTQGGQVTGFRGKALGLAGVLLVGFTAAFSGFPELRASGEWLGYEMALAKKNGEEVESRLRSYCERNAEFRPSRQLSRFSVTRVLGREAEEGDWEEAERDLRRVLARNPYDGESLANLARLLEEAGQFEEARNFHFRALGAVGAREQKYGVYFAYGMHLVKRGQERLAARNPEEGLAYFEEASVVLKHSFAKNYRRKEVVRPAQEWVRQQIDFLEGARIDAAVIPQISDWRTQQESADYAAFSWELR
ncbi:MAG: tetratricopeptide repeat protein, partial [Verrucomicrobiota bacterium]